MTEPVGYCAVPRLQEYCCKVILSNIDSVPSTGDIPFRVIRPVLERCKAEKLEQLEQASPHLENDTRVIWRKRCLDDFLEIRQANENGTMYEPESWREQYFESLAKRERKITDSASRLRGMYQKEEAGKRGRQTMYTTKAPPPKRGRWGKDHQLWLDPREIFLTSTLLISRPNRHFEASLAHRESAPRYEEDPPAHSY
ncbi:RNA polymerase II transcription factor SIII subunit A-domain-containing protein [Rhizoctonia solani]|nr:RNA polymerase II transcription factor SIII subunit A-domain-containing protein [Rhizoctonia solani]